MMKLREFDKEIIENIYVDAVLSDGFILRVSYFL